MPYPIFIISVSRHKGIQKLVFSKTSFQNLEQASRCRRSSCDTERQCRQFQGLKCGVQTKKNFLSLLGYIFLILLTSCRLGPSYQKPCIEIPPHWKTTLNKEETPCPIAYWWDVFEDDQLSIFELQAINNNPGLFVLMDRVAQSLAIIGVNKSALYPQVNVTPAYSETGSLFKLYLPPGGNLPIGNNFSDIYRIYMFNYQVPFNVNYQIDLFGKIRGQVDSAKYSAEAKEQNLQAAYLTLTTDLATCYYKIRIFDRQIILYEDFLNNLKKKQLSTKYRFEKGLVGEQEYLAAEQAVTDFKTTYLDTKRLRALQENALATLLGIPSSNFQMREHPITTPPPSIKPGLPSTLLLQRPDILSAERSMASSHAMIGSAYASFFPSLQLTGILGFLSPDFSQFLSWQSRLTSFGVNVAQTVFDGGNNRSNLNLQYALFNEASHEYQQVVLTAFQEVEEALINIETNMKQYEAYLASFTCSQKNRSISKKRHEAGLTNGIDLLDSERSLIFAENNVINMLGLRFISTIELVKALGGSW